jgi:hypothetical protein
MWRDRERKNAGEERSCVKNICPSLAEGALQASTGGAVSSRASKFVGDVAGVVALFVAKISRTVAPRAGRTARLESPSAWKVLIDGHNAICVPSTDNGSRRRARPFCWPGFVLQSLSATIISQACVRRTKKERGASPRPISTAESLVTPSEDRVPSAF